MFGSACFFEGPEAPFTQLGINVRVLHSGESKGLYHVESAEEDLLVLVGECLLLVEEQERHLHAWDFVHCPPGTRHAFVAAGDGPCVILMVGGRSSDQTFLYPRSELALRHGAGVERETASPAEAQAGLGEWRLERPAGWEALPWATQERR